MIPPETEIAELPPVVIVRFEAAANVPLVRFRESRVRLPPSVTVLLVLELIITVFDVNSGPVDIALDPV